MSNGWIKNISSDDFYSIHFNNYLGWDKINDKTPYYVLLETIKGKDKSSHKIGVEFDDISHGNFYWRDWTQSSLPFIDSGEVYWSGFSFQFVEDAKKFVELYGGKGNWMNDYEEFRVQCDNKRNGKIA